MNTRKCHIEVAMNYSELKTAIQDYTQTSESSFVTNIDTFIGQAETRIFFDIDLPDFRKAATGTTSDGTTYLSKPSDLFSVLSLARISSGNEYTYLLPKDVSFIREAYPDTDVKGAPEHYAHFDDSFFILGPVPDAAYTIQINYKSRPIQLSSTNTTTWLSTNAEAALLYATLVEAYTYLKGEEDIMRFYDTRYKEALASLARYSMQDVNSDNYRNGVRRSA